MVHLLRLGALGSQVEVRCVGVHADLMASAMRAAWSRCLLDAEPAPPPAPAVQVRLDDPEHLARRLMTTTQDITRALIRSQRGHLLMLHAGAVSDPETGRSLVYVAPGGTGKTTLSRRLGLRFGYLTDETVGIDDDGAIVPYPKPLSVRRTDEPGLKDEVSPDALGLLPAPAHPRVVRVVLLDRDADADRPVLEEVPFMDALFALTEQSSSLPLLDRPLHRLARLIDEAGPVLRVRYAEAADLDEGLTSLIGGAS